MELELGLALPVSTAYDPKKELLIGSPHMLQLGPWNHHIKKRRLNGDGAFQDEAVVPPRTLSLLLSWDHKHPNEEEEEEEEDDDDDDDTCNNFSAAASNKNGEDEGIIGWPPIKCRRKNIRRGHNNIHPTVNKSKYVKVKMEGVGIARKIDLSLFHSFQQLNNTLLDMFCTWTVHENSSGYKLTYLDNEGDWLLADDVSWRSFAASAQRLNLIRRRSSS